MKKMIISIIFIGMLLLTNFFAIAQIEKEELIELKYNYLIDTTFSEIITINEGVEIQDSNGGLVILDYSRKTDEITNRNNGILDFEVTGFIGWWAYEKINESKYNYTSGFQLLITNIGDTYEDKNEFLLYVDYYAIWPDHEQRIARRGQSYIKFPHNSCVLYHLQAIRASYYEIEKPVSYKVVLTTTAPEENTTNNEMIVPCEWGVKISGMVYKKNIFGYKKPYCAVIVSESDDPAHFSKYYSIAIAMEKNLTGLPWWPYPDGYYCMTVPARQSEFKIRAFQYHFMPLIILYQMAFMKSRIINFELLYRFFSKFKSTAPLEPNENATIDFIFGLFARNSNLKNVIIN